MASHATTEVLGCQVEGELQALGLSQEAAKGVLSLTHMGSLEELEAALPGHEACRELRRLFELAEVRCSGPGLIGSASNGCGRQHAAIACGEGKQSVSSGMLARGLCAGAWASVDGRLVGVLSGHQHSALFPQLYMVRTVQKLHFRPALPTVLCRKACKRRVSYLLQRLTGCLQSGQIAFVSLSEGHEKK